MIDNFKKDLNDKFGERINPIINKWINTNYFKEACEYGNDSSIPLSKKVSNTISHLLELIGLALTKPPVTVIEKVILSLKIKTVKHLHLMLNRRLKLQREVNKKKGGF